MTGTTTLEIDFDVHQKIESERRGFHEHPNTALRRLLGLPEVQEAIISTSLMPRDWSGKSVTLKHGTHVRMEYNGRVYEGRIDDGQWVIAGQKFGSPSAAAGIAVTKGGSKASLDGWKYWMARYPDSAPWVRIGDLRLVAEKAARIEAAKFLKELGI